MAAEGGSLAVNVKGSGPHFTHSIREAEMHAAGAQRSPWTNTGAPSNPADGPTLTRPDRWLRPCKGRRKVVCLGHFLCLTAAAYHTLHLTCVCVC